MNLIAGFDLETTGLDVVNDRVIEVGVVLWDWQKKQPLRLYNELVWEPGYPALAPIITEKTGITDEMLRKYGVRPIVAIANAHSVMAEAEAIAAYNGGNFDFLLWPNECARADMEAYPKDLLKIDAMTDVPYRHGLSYMKLVHLAADHGFLNPFCHRAQFDILTMLQIMANYSIDEIEALAKEPTVILISMLPFEENDRNKARGFRFKKEYGKKWMKRLKASQADKEEAECGFMVQRIPDDGRKI